MRVFALRLWAHELGAEWLLACLFLAFPDVYRPHRIGIQKESERRRCGQYRPRVRALFMAKLVSHTPQLQQPNFLKERKLSRKSRLSKYEESQCLLLQIIGSSMEGINTSSSEGINALPSSEPMKH